MLHDMKARGMAPKAILFNTANPILAQGAALADMALCDRFEDGDVTKLIHTGYELIFEPDQGVVTITRKA
jgi:predicted aconitase with swiveling domain